MRSLLQCQARLEARVATCGKTWLNAHTVYLSLAVALLEKASVRETRQGLRFIIVVLTLQWRFRAKWKLFVRLGPRLLHKPGWGANFFGGLLCGELGRQTPWFVVPNSVAPDNVFQIIDKYWRIKRPDLIISITGGAGKLTSLSSKSQIIEQGLARVVNVTKAWVITGGTDSGVMKMAGNALHKVGRKNTPCIGIMPWRVVAGREPLAGCEGGICTYPRNLEASSSAAPLNRHHTHFIFVDDTQRANDNFPAWGTEVPVRAAIEDMYANRLKVLMILLVVDGGPATLDTVYHFASQVLPPAPLTGSSRCFTAWKATPYDLPTMYHPLPTTDYFPSTICQDYLTLSLYQFTTYPWLRTSHCAPHTVHRFT